jgi:malate dehydrogenase (oxaloacetate-decarboxylating)
VVLAALLNALTLTAQRIDELQVVIVGLGAAGIAVADILLAAGARHIVGCDSRGAVHTQRADYLQGTMSSVKRELAQRTNEEHRDGSAVEVLEGADLLIGLSGPGVIPPEALSRMNADPIIFAMANPTPEISPEEAARYARIIATGRSDYPNQINNVLCFPGIFRGALDVRAREITESMKTAAARAIADIVSGDELREDYIIPSVFNREVVAAVASAVAEEARETGTAAAGAELGFGATEEFLPVR